VHPGCTIEVLTVPTRHFRQLSPFRAADFLEILPRLRRQVRVDGRQVVRLLLDSGNRIDGNSSLPLCIELCARLNCSGADSRGTRRGVRRKFTASLWLKVW
jgi:hypothetical protein